MLGFFARAYRVLLIEFRAPLVVGLLLEHRARFLLKNTPAKEPYMLSKEPYIQQESPIYISRALIQKPLDQKIPTFYQKSPVYSSKRALYSMKRAPYTAKALY